MLDFLILYQAYFIGFIYFVIGFTLTKLLYVYELYKLKDLNPTKYIEYTTRIKRDSGFGFKIKSYLLLVSVFWVVFLLVYLLNKLLNFIFFSER